MPRISERYGIPRLTLTLSAPNVGAERGRCTGDAAHHQRCVNSAGFTEQETNKEEGDGMAGLLVCPRPHPPRFARHPLPHCGRGKIFARLGCNGVVDVLCSFT
jgi:hypothetical protein